MVVAIQYIGIIFGLVMLYFTYFYFKRKEFTVIDLFLWFIVWIAFILGVIFPSYLDGFMEAIGVIGAMQLFSVAAILFLIAVVFFLYRQVRKNQQQVEKLVREIALKK